MVYFDNAATTFPKPKSVTDSMLECMTNYCANPGRSGHKLAKTAANKIMETRYLLCKLFNIDNPLQIIFTNNATESLNIAIKGLLKEGDHVITTSMEHNSVIRPIKELEKKGVINTVIQCNSDGIIEIDKIEKEIKKNTKLIATTHASNVTGTIMPIKKIGDICKKHNVLYLVDAAQAAGVYDIDVKEMNIDLLALPGHKGLMGPQGTGVLYIKSGIDIKQLKEGGTGSNSNMLTQPDICPDRYESGTLNTPGIVGLGEGIKFLLDTNIKVIREKEEFLLELLIKGLKSINGVTIYGPKDIKSRASVVSINIKDMDSTDVSYILDSKYDIAVRGGLHCAPLAHKTIGTIDSGTVRFSIGYFNTIDDVKKALYAVRKIAETN